MKDNHRPRSATVPLSLNLVLFVLFGFLVSLSIDNRTYAHIVAITPAASGSPSTTVTFSQKTGPTTRPVQSPKAVVVVGAANIRSGPGISYSRVGIVRRANELTVTGQVNNCKWLQVKTPRGQSGWILGTLTKLNTPCRLVPAAVVTPMPPNSTSAPSTRPTTSALSAVPILVKPDDGASVFGLTEFTWDWNGPSLAENQAFEVRVWAEGQPYHYGATALVRSTSVTFDVAGAFGVQQGGMGRSYFWTVALVEIDPPTQIGKEAPPRTITVELMPDDIPDLILPPTPTPTSSGTPSPTTTDTVIPPPTPTPTPSGTPPSAVTDTLIPPVTSTPGATMTPTTTAVTRIPLTRQVLQACPGTVMYRSSLTINSSTPGSPSTSAVFKLGSEVPHRVSPYHLGDR